MVLTVAPGIALFTSRRSRTTSTVVVSERSALLVDPAWEPDELAAIAHWLDQQGLTVRAGFATHAHEDHLLWHPGFGDAPRWASTGTAAIARRDRKLLVRRLGRGWPADLGKLVGRVTALPASRLPDLPGDEPIEVVTHDAHLPGHSALWLPARATLLAGDMLSDLELPLPVEADLDSDLDPALDASLDAAIAAERDRHLEPTASVPGDPAALGRYLAGLDALAPYVARARMMVPGHGNPTDRPLLRLDADRRYIDALLAGEDPDDPRRANPQMARVHARLRGLARAYQPL
jgi:glyoxylase-like metal-dependent hydrolase (beta-lactamase superfamily II)